MAAERWNPVQRVESVLLSILSLLDDAEISSPANVDAAVMLRDEPEAYKKRIAEDVEKSKKNIPEGFVVPTDKVLKEEALKAQKSAKAMSDDDDFWRESDDDFDFGSDTEADEEDEMAEDAGVGEEKDVDSD